MIKLDTHSIQIIALCTILLSVTFLGYLEFKRLHHKLDTIGGQIKVIEDLNVIRKTHDNIANTIDNTNDKLRMNIESIDTLKKENEQTENIVNRIFQNENYEKLDQNTIDELNSIPIDSQELGDNENDGVQEVVNEEDEEDDEHVEHVEHVEDTQEELGEGLEELGEGLEEQEEGLEEQEEHNEVSEYLEEVDIVEEVDIIDEVGDNELEENNTEDEICIQYNINSELSSKKLKELRELCKENGLSQSGTKLECINRIIKHNENN